MEEDLDKKLTAKERRFSPEYQTWVRQYRAKRAGYKAADKAKSGYKSGGSAAAVEADAKEAEKEWLGGVEYVAPCIDDEEDVEEQRADEMQDTDLLEGYEEAPVWAEESIEVPLI